MPYIDLLRERITQLHYPETMTKIEADIVGEAFFPGGRGLLAHENEFPQKKFMVLGQDFDSYANYLRSKERGREDIDRNPTWRNLLSFLKDAGIPKEECFFTNAFMGARKDEKNTGKSPGFKCPPFLAGCRELFSYQMELQKPALILVLGKYVAEFLSPLAEDLKDWEHITSFSSLDQKNLSVKQNILFRNGLRSSIVVLTHPSFRPVNVGRRKYRDLIGAEAELQMVKDALAKVEES